LAKNPLHILSPVPIYEYRCDNEHVFEVMQRMADDPVTTCTECGAPVQRVFHPVAVHFKGSGFYSTDYGRNRGGGGKDEGSKDEGSKDASKKETTTSKSESGSSSSSSSSGSGDSTGGSSKSD
jgi:putative FmdB family regulatory protein